MLAHFLTSINDQVIILFKYWFLFQPAWSQILYVRCSEVVPVQWILARLPCESGPLPCKIHAAPYTHIYIYTIYATHVWVMCYLFVIRILPGSLVSSVHKWNWDKYICWQFQICLTSMEYIRYKLLFKTKCAEISVLFDRNLKNNISCINLGKTQIKMLFWNY